MKNIYGIKMAIIYILKQNKNLKYDSNLFSYESIKNKGIRVEILDFKVLMTFDIHKVYVRHKEEEIFHFEDFCEKFLN